MNDQTVTSKVSAVYACPLRGPASLRPPDPERLGRAASVAKSIGLDRLHIPVLEESLFLPVREKIAYLDGLVQGLDRVEAVRMEALLMLPAQHVFGMRWIIPDLAGPSTAPDAGPAFVAGGVRRLRPYSWWADPFILRKRLRAFGEALGAVAGHPGLKGLCVLNRELEWSKPPVEAAVVFLKALLAEVRDRMMKGQIVVGLGWGDLLEPALAEGISGDVECFRIGGTEHPPGGIEPPGSVAQEIALAAFMGVAGAWLFEKPVEAEMGWSASLEDEDDPVEACGRYGSRGLEGITWMSLADPDPSLLRDPPWALYPQAARAGLLDYHLEPKPEVEECVKHLKGSGSGKMGFDFIDISREEYRENPGMHLCRLWGHFKDTF